MTEPTLFPGRFRHRLTIAFVLVAGLSSGVLAAGSYALVRESRDQRFVDRSIRQAEANLELDALGGAGQDIEEVLAVYQRRVGFETLAVAGTEIHSSLPGLELKDLPVGLQAADATADELPSAYSAIDGEPYLVVAGRVPGSGTDLYFLFSRSELESFMTELRTVLLVGWLLVTLAAAAVGNAVARRTLRPVRDASVAAHALASGMLETRLDTARDDEFGAWARDFNRMATVLQQQLAALSEATERERRFTADVAHELRTPLGSVVAAATLLEEDLDELPQGSRRPLELLIAELRRLRTLVDDLLELSRLDAGQEVLNLEPVRVDEAVAGTIRSYGWTDGFRVDAQACLIETDRRVLERIVVNLLSNARRHGRPPASVSLRRLGDGVSLEVRDAGSIPAAQLERIFDRFAKLDDARAGGGHGLGLAIALQYAELLGGSLGVRSDATGTTFALRLPPRPPTRPPSVGPQQFGHLTGS